ncbi:MAG: helix-turn-helix domain-containing protein [Firmicutes bacterium]|nr:helix-turn-helix domain-containing protein [Bacillota bacterium]
MIEYELHRSNSNNYYYCRVEQDLQHHTHVQNSFEFVYVFEGEINVYIGGQSYTLVDGDAIFILPHQIHSYMTTKKSSYFLAIFSPSFVYDYYIVTNGKIVSNPVFRPEQQIITALQALNPADIYKTKSCLYNLVHIFDQTVTYQENTNASDDKFLKKSLNYIERNFMHDASLDGLAKELSYDYNYTSNMFNKVFAINFLHFINGYRISHSKYLLANTSDTISTIGTACGYDSIRSFNRNFIKLVGTTPTEYRKGNKPSLEENNFF